MEGNSPAKKALTEMLDKLEVDKPLLIAGIREGVNSYIANQSLRECISLRSRDANGVICDLPASATINYISALKSFCLSENHEGKTLDSGLTEPVVDVVVKEFSKFYETHSDEIALAITPLIVQNEVFRRSLAETLLQEAGSEFPSALRSKAVEILIHKLAGAFTANLATATANAVSVAATKTVAVAVSIPISYATAALIIKFIAVNLKVVLAKVMASAAFKVAIAIAVKKFVVAAVLAGIIKLVAVKLGITTAGAFMALLLPLLLAFLAYEGYHFPAKLGAKVSEKISEELSGNITKIHTSVLDSIIEQVLKAGTGGLISELTSEISFIDILNEVSAELKKL